MDVKGCITTGAENSQGRNNEMSKYHEKTALVETMLNKVKNIPLIGLEHILEVYKSPDTALDGCYYICVICSKKMTAPTLVAHIKSVPHKLRYLEIHYKQIYNKYGSYELKQWTLPLLKEFTKVIQQTEKKTGRKKLKRIPENELSSTLKELKQTINDTSNQRKQSPSTNKNQKQSPRKSQEVPIYTGSQKRRHSQSPVPSHSQSHSESNSNDPCKHNQMKRQSRPRQKSPFRNNNRFRNSSPPLREIFEERARRIARMKLKDFREAEMRIRARHKNQKVVYEKIPESHPFYNTEWEMFWKRRYSELQKKGIDPRRHDFEGEWEEFWSHRMNELMDKHFNFKREILLRKLGLEDPDLKENKNVSNHSNSFQNSNGENVKSHADRYQTQQEENKGSATALNPSSTCWDVTTKKSNDSSKLNEICTNKVEHKFSVIGTLNLLKELKNHLGIFGHAVSALFEKAAECNEKGEDTLKLFKDEDNLILLRYVKEKLSSQISTETLEGTPLLRAKMAVKKCNWLQSRAEKLISEEKYLGLDILGIAKATLGKETFQIAQYIAQHLLQVKKTNASEADLQNILYGVSQIQTKLLAEASKKDQFGNVAVETASLASIPIVTVQNKTKDRLSIPIETPEVPKQTQHPSVIANNADKKVTDSECGSSNNHEKEHSNDLDYLSLEDLKSLLKNYYSLNAAEKEALTIYLKSLEASVCKKVMKLREICEENTSDPTNSKNIILEPNLGNH